MYNLQRVFSENVGFSFHMSAGGVGTDPQSEGAMA